MLINILFTPCYYLTEFRFDLGLVALSEWDKVEDRDKQKRFVPYKMWYVGNQDFKMQNFWFPE